MNSVAPRTPLFGASVALAMATAPGSARAEPPTPTAQIQVWATAYDMDVDPQADAGGYGDPEADIGLSLARARVGLEGGEQAVSWRIEVGNSAPYDTWFESNQPAPTINLVDAWIAATPRVGPADLRLSAGSQRTPFGRENQISSRDLIFQDRGVASEHLSPGRDVGVLAEYALDAGLVVTAGVFNGNGDVYGDVDDGLLTSGRVEYAGGKSYSTWDPEQDNAFGVGASVIYDMELATSILGLGGDVLARVGGFSVMLEVMQATVKPTAGTTVSAPQVFDKTSRLGLTGQLGYYIPAGDGGWELAARYSRYDDAIGVLDHGDVGLVNAGLTHRDVARGVDIGAGYILRIEHGGEAIPNDTARLWVQLRYPQKSRG
jgi:hypothetical protein